MDSNKTKKLSRGTVRLINEGIERAKSEGKQFNNRYVLCQVLCELVEEKYSGFTLDYQLNRMGLTTTGRFLDAIDLFFYKYPDALNELDNKEERFI